MKIIHRYILGQLIRNLLMCLMVVVFLFLTFDFFDRIDNILAEDTDLWTTISYFLYKIPNIASLMLPVAIMASVLFTIGIMSKNSEITAMRASGLKVKWIAKPLFILGLVASISAMMLNEFVVPWSQRRAQEIYNIDIRQKHKTGTYSQHDFWWRDRDTFYSVGMFDSRDDTLHDVSVLRLNDSFNIWRRTDAGVVTYVDKLLGWTMKNVYDYRLNDKKDVSVSRHYSLPLPVSKAPADFYDVKTNPSTMSFRELRRFTRELARNGLPVAGNLAYLYEKISFPFLSLITTLVVLPFALKPARSGSMAASILAGLVIGFSYYAIHSFAIALGRAELINPLLAAWTANILMGIVGLILLTGAEAP